MFTWQLPSCQAPIKAPTVSYGERAVTVTFHSRPPTPACRGGTSLQYTRVSLAHRLAGRYFIDGACLPGQPSIDSSGCLSPKSVTNVHTTTSSLPVAALRTHDPNVVVTPSTGLHEGEMVRVSVSGFGVGGKFFISECASPADANSAGCGQQLAAQVFGVTDDGGRGSVSYAVHTDANSRPYDTATTESCHDQCVLVATAGIGYGYTYAPLSFSER